MAKSQAPKTTLRIKSADREAIIAAPPQVGSLKIIGKVN
jgi:hypothetical protein